MLEAHMNRVRASNNGQPGTITFEGEQVPIQRYLDFLAGQITPSGERQECNSSNAAAFTALSKKEQSDVLHGRMTLVVPVDLTLPEGCTNRNWIGSGGVEECDGCRCTLKQNDEEVDVEGMSTTEAHLKCDWKSCPRCKYAVCANCRSHMSRGTCYCKDSNFGHAYPAEREYYQHGRW